MLTLDYSSILNSQYQEKKGGYKRVFSFYFFLQPVFSFFSLNWLAKRINKSLTAHLLVAKGTYAYLLENVSDLKDKDLRDEIVQIEKSINELYSLETSLEHHIAIPGFSDLKPSYEIILEMIDVTYEILRLLKRNTHKTPLAEPSEEAKIAIGHSKKTLNKILYGR